MNEEEKSTPGSAIAAIAEDSGARHRRDGGSASRSRESGESAEPFFLCGDDLGAARRAGRTDTPRVVIAPMKRLEKLHAFLNGPGRAFIKPPVPHFTGIDEKKLRKPSKAHARLHPPMPKLVISATEKRGGQKKESSHTKT